MSIPYYLAKNSPGGAANTYHPVAQTRNDLKLDDLVTQVATLTGQTPAEVAKTLKAAGPALGTILAQGNDVEWTDLGLFKPNISNATVEGPQGVLPTTARSTAAFSPRGGFKDTLAAATFERIAAPSKAPEWKQVTAMFGNITSLNMGNVIEIIGSNLSYNPDTPDNDEGIFLEVSPSGTMVQATTVTVHTAQKIQFLITAGLTPNTNYTLQLHTRGGSSSPTTPVQTFVWSGRLRTAA